MAFSRARLVMVPPEMASISWAEPSGAPPLTTVTDTRLLPSKMDLPMNWSLNIGVAISAPRPGVSPLWRKVAP